MMGDMSVNCPACGSNPHEECRMPGMGNHQAIDCLVNPVAADSRMDDMTEPETMLEHIEEGHPSMMIRRSFEKAWSVVKEDWRDTPIGRLIAQSGLTPQDLEPLSESELRALEEDEAEEKRRMAEYDAKMAFYQAFIDEHFGGEFPDQDEVRRRFSEAKPMRIESGSHELRQGMGEIGDLLTDRRKHPIHGTVFRPASVEDFMREKGIDPEGYKQ
tara:strand:- start:2471 stop:3115 length:645 start_codon:yes stop_codon:yes gene_type:complete